MEQFTASEVRDAITWKYGDKLTRISAMLTAYADLLEAQEKAVPVYQHRNKNGPMLRWFDCSEETFMAMEHNEHDREHFDRRILYTHPSPSDAERLAEALRKIVDTDYVKRCCNNGIEVHYPDAPPEMECCGDPDVDFGPFARIAMDALTAHYAQSQPPAESEYAPTYPDQAKDPFWTVPGMVDTRPKTHGTQARPAASVTDAMVRRLKRALPLFCADVTMADARAALEAALAAQENPNG